VTLVPLQIWHLSEQLVELDDCFVSLSVDIKTKVNFTSIYSYYKTICQFVSFDIQTFVHLELGKSDVVSINQTIFKDYAHSCIDNYYQSKAGLPSLLSQHSIFHTT
jgi:hypothetical protein